MVEWPNGDPITKYYIVSWETPPFETGVLSYKTDVGVMFGDISPIARMDPATRSIRKADFSLTVTSLTYFSIFLPPIPLTLDSAGLEV